MQVVSKIESTSPSLSTPTLITPKSLKELMEAITKRLLSGQKSANQLRSLFNKRLGFKLADVNDDTKDFNDDQHSFDHHSWVALSSFEDCITMLKSYDFDQQEIITKKRKVDQTVDDHDDHYSKSGEISDAKISKERRGCYKRRKAGQSWTKEATSLIDDGYAWRKYGQKEILHTKYPRNYYRCTHKHEQNCQATKQVQQISENPTKYKIIYNGLHTCKNLHKTSSLIIDDPQDNQKPSFFLSFGSNNHPTPKHALNNNPPMFPSTTFHNNNSSTTTNATIVKEESHMVAPHDHDHGHDVANKQYPSSSSSCENNHHPSSSSLSCDVTSTGISSLVSTPVSEQSDVMSQHEFITNPFGIMDEDIFLSIMDMKQDYYNPHLDGLF